MSFVNYNPSPTGRRVGDCAVRAIAKALDISWDDAYTLIAVKGFAVKDLPSSNAVWGAVLHDHGFTRQALPDTCPVCYTFSDFARDNPQGVFVVGTGTHVATIVDGNLYDAWESSDEPVAFVWFRKDD